MTWFSRLRNWTTDASNGIGIRADYHDSEDNNFATGLNQCLNIAGLNSPTANIPMGSFKFTGLANGTASTDSATLGQIQTSVASYGVDSSGTDAYAITLSPALASYVAGQVFRFYAATINTGAASLNINALGAKTIKKDKNVDLADGDIASGQINTVIYDGTNFQLQSPIFGLLTQNGAPIYAADAGASDSYAITLPTVPAAYATGMVVRFKANTANTGACSVNVNALGAKTIKKDQGADLADNDIAANQIVEVIYDGANFQMLSPVFGCVGQNGQSIYAVDTGAANAYVITLSPVPVAYATGMVVRFKSSFQNSGSATLNVNGLGAKTLVKNGSTNLASADIVSGQFVEAAYDGTNFQVISPITNGLGTVTSIATGSGLSGGTITGSGTLTAAAGVPLQCLQATKTDTQSITSATTVDITSLTISITPASVSNKILILWSINAYQAGGGTGPKMDLLRGSTPIFQGTGASRTLCTIGVGPDLDVTNQNGSCSNYSGMYLDSPATTSATTYKFCAYDPITTVGTININLNSGDTTNFTRYPSSITVIEIKG